MLRLEANHLVTKPKDVVCGAHGFGSVQVRSTAVRSMRCVGRHSLFDFEDHCALKYRKHSGTELEKDLQVTSWWSLPCPSAPDPV